MREQYENKLATQEGELRRSERMVEEMKLMMNEKSLEGSRLSSSLGNEVHVLREKVQKLEREKREWKDRCEKYGEDL